MDVSVIIVNYNTCQLLINCLNSIFKFTHDINYEVIIVDNNSTDNSAKIIKKLYPNVKIILSKNNLGFGKANNLAFDSSVGQYLFFLNSDTLLIENSIKLLHEYIKINSTIGALGAILVDSDDMLIHSHANKFTSCITEYRILLSKIFIRKSLVKVKNKYNAFNNNTIAHDVAYVTGADLMIPKKVFNELLGFDPNFFMYYEENELQYRMMQIGLKRMILSSTRIIHLEGKSSVDISHAKRFMIGQSMLYYFKKKLSRFQFFIFKSFLYLGHSLVDKKKFKKTDNKLFMNLFNPLKNS